VPPAVSKSLYNDSNSSIDFAVTTYSFKDILRF
jgi:hypothetical protein